MKAKPVSELPFTSADKQLWIKGRKKAEMSAYIKSRTFYSVHFPLAGLLLVLSLSLICSSLI